MTAHTGAAGPDVGEMKAVHNVFRDTLGAASQLIGETESDERRSLLVNFYENILSFLNAHHQAEEELVFPLLRERCANQLGLVERIAGQHTAVHDQIAVTQNSVASLAGGTHGAREECATELSRLGDVLSGHLDEEETEVLPLCALHLSTDEWAAQPGRGMQLFQGDKIWLILGLIRQRMNAAQRAEMLSHLPPPALNMWTDFGEQSFNDLIAEIGAPLT
jgi:hemerythrin-like domain-containing protein